jgi:hypothetical protein
MHRVPCDAAHHQTVPELTWNPVAHLIPSPCRGYALLCFFNRSGSQAPWRLAGCTSSHRGVAPPPARRSWLSTCRRSVSDLSVNRVRSHRDTPRGSFPEGSWWVTDPPRAPSRRCDPVPSGLNPDVSMGTGITSGGPDMLWRAHQSTVDGPTDFEARGTSPRGSAISGSPSRPLTVHPYARVLYNAHKRWRDNAHTSDGLYETLSSHVIGPPDRHVFRRPLSGPFAPRAPLCFCSSSRFECR